MSTLLNRAAMSCAVILFLATTAVLSDEAVPSPVALAGVALTTKLTSDDTWTGTTGKLQERQLTVNYTAHPNGYCLFSIHRDANSSYPYIGNKVTSETKALTYYMVPLDKMSDQLTVSNVKNEQQAATYISGASHAQVFTYSDDTGFPLAGLKTDVEPTEVSSQGPVPKYPTFSDQTSAKNAIAALAKAAASCATPAPQASQR